LLGAACDNCQKLIWQRGLQCLRLIPRRPQQHIGSLGEQLVVGAREKARRVAIDLEQTALADLREEARRKGETGLANISHAPEQVAKNPRGRERLCRTDDRTAGRPAAMADISDLGQDVAGGLIADLRAGVDGAEALSNALDNVIDKLVELSLNSLFSMSEDGGGILGAVFSAISGIRGKIGRNRQRRAVRSRRLHGIRWQA